MFKSVYTNEQDQIAVHQSTCSLQFNEKPDCVEEKEIQKLNYSSTGSSDSEGERERTQLSNDNDNLSEKVSASQVKLLLDFEEIPSQNQIIKITFEDDERTSQESSGINKERIVEKLRQKKYKTP